MMNTLREEAREIQVLGEYDVVVVGGGIAGVAAALAAARLPKTKVCLLERYCGLGGLATLGNVICFLPLCDGLGHQVIGGITEELARLAVSLEPNNDPLLHIQRVPACWDNPKATLEERRKERFITKFNPHTFAWLMEKLLLKHRVRLYYDCRVDSVVKEGSRIQAVVFGCKSGRCAVRCKTVVDCTGSADICVAAGEKTVVNPQNCRCGWYYFSKPEGPVQLAPCTDNANHVYFEKNSRRLPVFREDKVESVTAQIIRSREFMMADLARRSQQDGCAYQVIHGVSMPTFRMGRRLAGKVTLKESDNHRWFSDTLGLTGDWRHAGPVYALPLRCLAAVRTQNLITAGRCISSTGDTWDVTRVIPTCGITGEIAGTAAAFLATDSYANSFSELEIPALRNYLLKKKNIIDKRLLQNV